jgi:hypothetical protein
MRKRKLTVIYELPSLNDVIRWNNSRKNMLILLYLLPLVCNRRSTHKSTLHNCFTSTFNIHQQQKKNETKFVNPKFQNRNENFNFFNIYTKSKYIIVASFSNQEKNKRKRVKFHGDVYLTKLFRFWSVVALWFVTPPLFV